MTRNLEETTGSTVVSYTKEEGMKSLDISAAQAGRIVIGGDLEVNRLGFGSMRLTGPGIWGEPVDREEAKAVLRRAVELGTTFIDTADSYGPHVSEDLIAEALYPYPQDLMIATKGGLERTGPDRWPHNARPEHLKAACEGSLRRLRLERIPLYQLHRPDQNVPYEESVGALVELQQQGKIQHVGVSNVDERLLGIARGMTNVVSVQNRYNFGDRESEALVDLCERDGMAFLPWAPMHDIADKELASIAVSHHATTRQVVLAWLLARSPAILPIPGTGSVAHLEENIAAAGLRLDPDEVH
jgi:pyridoxine 4-dehydrogenase